MNFFNLILCFVKIVHFFELNNITETYIRSNFITFLSMLNLSYVSKNQYKYIQSFQILWDLNPDT